MKKILAMVLAMMLVLSMSTAFAAVVSETTATDASVPKTFNFTKEYKTTAGKTPATYPAEILDFTITAAGNNPADTMISIADQTIDANPDEIAITVPAYTVPGSYVYTIKEVEGTTQGVTYDTTTEIKVQVLVTYDETDATHTKLLRQVVFTAKDADNNKVATFANKYDLGNLDVSKTVTGNLGSQSDEFTVKVTFTATEDIKSDITYVDGTETKTITAAMMSDKTETVDITVKHGETVKFTNIPAGVSYTVVENDYTEGDKNNSLEGYDEAEYAFSDAEKKIAADDKDTVGITNNKETTVDTGISLDNAPYMILMALVVIAGAALIVKRASANR